MSGENSTGKLELNLLGSPEVWLDGQIVTAFRSNKARALLYYLAVTGRAQPRSVLAGLFWGGVTENHARRSLTMTLSNLRQLVGGHLIITRETVAFDTDSDYRLDVAAFETGLETFPQNRSVEALKQAIALYRGDFLEGFYLHDAPEFEQWVLIERSRLRERVLQALHTLADHLATQNDLPQAIETMRRLLVLEPWREEAHRYLMLLLARDGQRSAALAQFEICRQMLAAELDVEPGPETMTLYNVIRTKQFMPTATPALPAAPVIDRQPAQIKKPPSSRVENEIQRPLVSRSVDTPGSRHNLLPQSTPFIGRERELADIIRRLTDRDCRLLTLVGSGGIGKTRLALQAAQRFIDQDADQGFFEHGVLFVPLAAVESINSVVSAVAEAANLTFHSNLPPQQQLLDFLQKKEMLLILDNLEHLLSPPQAENDEDEPAAGAARLIADILTAAPRAKILVTSREALNLQEAWFHPVNGLSFPPRQQPFAADVESTPSPDRVSLDRYDAVQLFVQSAARARVEFSLAAERAAIERICQLVEGIPLAIELAAAWLKTLPAAAIAAEIERDLDILTTRHQNVPERHRSMRVVLAQSWQRLTEAEREVFKRLSVFRGGFAFDAARTVAGATLIDLATFVDKSLLQVTSAERYHIHELLRQYAAERLAESPETVAQTYDTHCATYGDFLEQRSEALMGGQQRQALAEIAAEYDNAWAAWRWALKELKLPEIQKLVMPLQLFCQFQSRYLEGADAWEEAYRRLTGVEATDPVKLTLVNVIAWWGWMLIRLGRLDQAETVLKQCCDLYQQLGIPAIQGYGTNPRIHLSLIATIRGDYATALQYGEQARRDSETHRHQVNLCEAYYVLASAASGQGDYETAQRYARQAYDLARKRGDHWYAAFCLNELGNIALALGDIATAQQHFEASYTLRKEFDDPGGMALALNHLGEIALRQHAYEQAQQLYQASLEVYRNIFDKGGLAQTYHGLGMVAGKQGDPQTAQHYLQQALRLTMEIEYVPLTLSILSTMGDLLLNSDRPEPGLLVLAFVQQQAGGNPTAQDETRKRLAQFRAGAQQEQIAMLERAEDQAKHQTLAEVVARMVEDTV